MIERDGNRLRCTASPMPTWASWPVFHVDYRGGARGSLLLAGIERRARRLGLASLFVLTTHTAHWFVEHGFRPSDIDSLPTLRRDTYSHARKSKILVKSLT